MDLRQAIEKNKAWILPLLLAISAGAIFYTFWMPRSDDLAGPVEKAYYTTDGKTYFEDSLTKRCPFDHEGKSAYRAFVFRNKPSDAPYVAYVGRHAANVKSNAPPGIAVPQADLTTTANLPRAPDEIAKPDMKTWVPANSPEGMAIVNSIVASTPRPEPIMPD